MLNNCQEGKIFAKEIDGDGETTLNFACFRGYNQVSWSFVCTIKLSVDFKLI